MRGYGLLRIITDEIWVDKFANLKNTIHIPNPLFLGCSPLHFLFLCQNEDFLEINIIHLGIHPYFLAQLGTFLYLIGIFFDFYHL